MVGNRLNFSGFFVDIVISSIIIVSIMLKVNRIFSNVGGSGKIIIVRI